VQAIIRTLQAAVRKSPAAVVVAIVALTVLFGAATGLTEQDQGFQNFLPDNEISATQDTISQEFSTNGDRSPVQVSVYAPEGGDMLSADGIAVAAQLQQQVRSDPDLAAALADESTGQPAVVTWGDLVLQAAQAQGIDIASLTDEQVDQLHVQALANVPEAQRGLLSATLGGEVTETSATAGVVIVFLQEDAVAATGDSPAQEALVGLRGEINGFEVAPFDIAALGAEITDTITSQLSSLLLLAVGLIIVILVAIYRRPMDVIASLLGLGFTIIWMQGGSALVGPRGLGWTGGQSEMTMAIPILLVGLGVDYGIHLTMRYREERSEGQGPGEAAQSAVGAVGVALLLATITTIVGFLTNLSNPLPPLQDFGVFAAIGVASAFVIMTGFVPAVRVLVDRRRRARGTLKPERSHSTEPGLLGRAASAVAPVAVGRPWAVIGGAVVLVVLGGLSATNLSTEFSQTEFFPSDSPALAEIERTQEAFQGDITESTQVLVRGDVATVDGLNGIVAYEAEVEQLDDVRDDVAIDSVVTRLAGVQAAMASMGQGEGELPEGVDPVALQEFFMALQASGFDPATGVADGTDVPALYDGLLALDPSSATVLSGDGDGGYDAALVNVPTRAGDQVDDLRDGLDAASQQLTDAGLESSPASEGLLIDLVLSELQASQVQGLVLTLVASMLILALAFWARDRKPMLGVLAITAVAFVVAWVFGLMALFEIPFNVMTAMVSALAIGIGVPFGIHVVNRFLEDRRTHPDTMSAMVDTLRNTGGALVGSAVTTMAGFGVLVFSTIGPFRQFGVVLALTIGLALLASIIVLPAMLTLWARRHPFDDPVEPSPAEDRGTSAVAGGRDPNVEVLAIERD
jgi:predicted RND superfamily exporter protein